MSLINALKGFVRGYGQPTTAEAAEPQPSLRITVSYTGSPAPAVSVSSSEVEARLAEYRFIDAGPLPALKAPERWYDEDTQKRRLRDKSDKAHAWLLPFLPPDVAASDALLKVHEWGPNNAGAVVQAIRAMVREKRKAKEPHEPLLRALYASALMTDLADSLKFEGMPVHTMATYVALADLQGLKADWATTGYQAVDSLGKTDVKWLVEAFGEPAEHQSARAVWAAPRENAIRRYCWSELASKNDARKHLGQPEQTMRQWLYELVEQNIGYHKEWLARCAEAEAKDAERSAVVEAAWAATRASFVVADVETTGLDPASDELLELAAVVVTADGQVVSDFSVLVRTQRAVPDNIAKLTGITEQLVAAEGRALDVALGAFLEHIGDRPVFCHNAAFDAGFLRAAAKQTRRQFKNAVHDTLPLARRAWPGRASYRLANLAEHAGGRVPTHRALADARTTLDVLLAARKAAGR